MTIVARSESRDGYAVRVLAVHTTEGIDHLRVDDAVALRDAGWWEGSSHAIADGNPGTLLTPAEGCVPYDRAAWTLRSGNRWSENIELVAQASWPRATWLANRRLLDLCALWLAVRSKARGIPLVKLTPAQYRAGQWGVIGHVDHTVGYQDGTHWDPGPYFPWDVVIAKAREFAGSKNSPSPTVPTVPMEDDMPTIRLAPGEDVCIPDPYAGDAETDLRIAVDNPLQKLGADGKPASSARVRIAVQDAVSPSSWRAAGGAFGPSFDTTLPLGHTGAPIGKCLAVSVANRDTVLPVTVVLAPHPA